MAEQSLAELEQTRANMVRNLQNTPPNDPSRSSKIENLAALDARIEAARKASGQNKTTDQAAAQSQSQSPNQNSRKAVNYSSTRQPKTMSNRAARHVEGLTAKAEVYREFAKGARQNAANHAAKGKNARSMLPGRVGNMSVRMQARHHANAAARDRSLAMRLDQKATTRENRAARVRHRQELKYQTIAELKALPKKATVAAAKGVAAGARGAVHGMQNALAAFKQWKTTRANGQASDGAMTDNAASIEQAFNAPSATPDARAANARPKAPAR